MKCHQYVTDNGRRYSRSAHVRSCHNDAVSMLQIGGRDFEPLCAMHASRIASDPNTAPDITFRPLTDDERRMTGTFVPER